MAIGEISPFTVPELCIESIVSFKKTVEKKNLILINCSKENSQMLRVNFFDVSSTDFPVSFINSSRRSPVI